MAHHSKELKQKLINDMSPPNSLTTPELLAKYGVPKQTIYSWRKAALEQLAQWKVACLSGFNTTPQVDKQQKSAS